MVQIFCVFFTFFFLWTWSNTFCADCYYEALWNTRTSCGYECCFCQLNSSNDKLILIGGWDPASYKLGKGRVRDQYHDAAFKESCLMPSSSSPPVNCKSMERVDD